MLKWTCINCRAILEDELLGYYVPESEGYICWDCGEALMDAELGADVKGVC